MTLIPWWDNEKVEQLDSIVDRIKGYTEPLMVEIEAWLRSPEGERAARVAAFDRTH